MTPRTKLPTDTTPRVFRGGSWFNTSATFVRAAYRNDSSPTLRSSVIGFRCAQRGARMPLRVQP